jgi:hypothetical protein
MPAVSAAALAGLLAYVVVKVLVAHRVARTITEVSHALSRAADGERVEVRVKGRNETATLASSFNLVSGRLAERDMRIARLAFEDEATGLPNMRAMEANLANMRAANDPATLFAVMVGVDNFGQLRLAIGETLCPKLVAAIAHRISATYGEISVGCAGRIGSWRSFGRKRRRRNNRRPSQPSLTDPAGASHRITVTTASPAMQMPHIPLSVRNARKPRSTAPARNTQALASSMPPLMTTPHPRSSSCAR